MYRPHTPWPSFGCTLFEADNTVVAVLTEAGNDPSNLSKSFVLTHTQSDRDWLDQTTTDNRSTYYFLIIPKNPVIIISTPSAVIDYSARSSP